MYPTSELYLKLSQNVKAAVCCLVNGLLQQPSHILAPAGELQVLNGLKFVATCVIYLVFPARYIHPGQKKHIVCPAGSLEI